MPVCQVCDRFHSGPIAKGGSARRRMVQTLGADGVLANSGYRNHTLAEGEGGGARLRTLGVPEKSR